MKEWAIVNKKTGKVITVFGRMEIYRSKRIANKAIKHSKGINEVRRAIVGVYVD